MYNYHERFKQYPICQTSRNFFTILCNEELSEKDISEMMKFDSATFEGCKKEIGIEYGLIGDKFYVLTVDDLENGYSRDMIYTFDESDIKKLNYVIVTEGNVAEFDYKKYSIEYKKKSFDFSINGENVFVFDFVKHPKRYEFFYSLSEEYLKKVLPKLSFTIFGSAFSMIIRTKLSRDEMFEYLHKLEKFDEALRASELSFERFATKEKMLTFLVRGLDISKEKNKLKYQDIRDLLRISFEAKK